MRRLTLLVVLLACGCGDGADPDAGPRDAGPRDAGTDAGTDAGPTPDRVVTACDEVVLEGAAAAGVPALEGWPLLFAEARGADAVFRAPAVARPTFLTVGETVLRVDPRAPDAFDVPGLAADCGSFQHGVASGDPRADGVVLWTRWTPDEPVASATLEWTVATDPALASVVASGTAEATPDADWTVRVAVDGLSPSTTYYYRFADPDGTASALGRTRTAAVDATHLRFAVASCSSLYSGWFNAYRRIAERDGLDLVIHLGDYIYDFVDEDEPVRVPPSGEVEDPSDLAGHRRRHAQYLADPDLRLARRAHPWFLLWDNHDLVRGAPGFGGGAQAFREWNPIRPPADGAPPEVLYRRLSYGALADVFAVDMYLFQGRDTLPGGAPSALGDAQYAWLTGELGASTATWRILGMQKVFAPLGPFSGWNDFEGARDRLLAFFVDEGIGDNLFLTGDSHFTAFMDVAGDGPVGGELLASSISRGNFDEQLGEDSARFIESIRDGYLRDNPHHVDLELTSHGYGLVDVRSERLVAEMWYSPIRGPAGAERFGGAYAIERGANRYDRTRVDAPTAPD